MRLISILIIILSASTLAAQSPTTPAKTEKSGSYKYLLYLPDKYKENKDKTWPLIIYLHGKSACGNNLDKVRRYGLPFFLDRDMKLDAVVAAPQCPMGKNWVTDNWFITFLDDIKEKYHIDENRIYLTGMSLGGFGTFSLAIKYPEIFAAISPFCGGGQPQTVSPIKEIPTWVFHGDRDEQVPLRRSQEMVDAIRKCGGNPKFTILKGMPHDIHRNYNNPELYEWMLSQSKNGPVYTTKLPESVLDTTIHVTALAKAPKEKPLLKPKTRRQKRQKTDPAKEEKIEESEKMKFKFE
jgi:predicted peptidase